MLLPFGFASFFFNCSYSTNNSIFFLVPVDRKKITVVLQLMIWRRECVRVGLPLSFAVAVIAENVLFLVFIFIRCATVCSSLQFQGEFGEGV